MAVGLTDLLESSGMNGVPAFVGLALLSAFCVCLSPAARPSGRFWRRSSCQCLCCWAFTRRLRRSCFVSLIHRCRWRRCHRLCRCFSAFTALPAGCPPRHLLLAGAPLPLIFLAVWLLLVGIWWDCRSAWHLSAAVLTTDAPGTATLTRYHSLNLRVASRLRRICRKARDTLAQATATYHE